jgi:4-amino-4-deoxy-L-arabinose transferase-like glycosyltransferase
VTERARSLSTPLSLAVLGGLGLALFFPGIGSFGLWDPYEVRIADVARAIVTGHGTFADAGRQLGRPPLPVWLVTIGFQRLGVSELGGRLPIAFTALLALLACYYAGSGLIRRRGALVGSFVLALTPGFLLGARQLMTEAPLILGSALAVGGLARAAWPVEGTAQARRLIDLVLALVGLVIGQLAGGVLVGVVAPLAAVTIALAAAPRSERAATLPWLAVAGAGALAAFAAAVVIWARPSAGYSPLIGGSPHALLNTAVFTSPLRQLGYGLFPWVALLPMAGIHALSSTTSDDEPQARDWFGRVTLVCWFVSLYSMGLLQAAGAQELLLPLAPAVLLLVGAYLDDLLDSDELQPFAALTAALGAIMIGRDLYMQPESYVGAHMIETLRWPGPLPTVPYLLIGYSAFFAAVVAMALGVPLGWMGGRAAAASSDGSAAPHGLRGRLVLVGGAIGASLIMALATAHYVIPQCSKTLSPRELYGKSAQLDPAAPLGQYRFNATGSSYYTGGRTPVTLGTLDDLFKFLQRPEHVFVMAGVDELPSIEQSSKQKQTGYYVVDDANARFILLSNRLKPGERDVNPLKLFVSDKAPPIAHALEVNFDNKVQLVGWDLPATVDKGQDIKLRLIFKVLAPIPGSWKVFVHLDGPGSRINGDHVPLEGRFPTQYWVPGYYIIDEHMIRPDRALEVTGYHQLYMGLFLGSERMKIVAGPQDGENRARLGGFQVR